MTIEERAELLVADIDSNARAESKKMGYIIGATEQKEIDGWHRMDEDIEIPKGVILVQRAYGRPSIMTYTPAIKRWMCGDYGYTEEGLRHMFTRWMSVPEITEE